MIDNVYVDNIYRSEQCPVVYSFDRSAEYILSSFRRIGRIQAFVTRGAHFWRGQGTRSQ